MIRGRWPLPAALRLARQDTYLRNVVKKYMETEQHEALFPVIATCMRFTQAEVDEILAGRERRISQGTLRGLR